MLSWKVEDVRLTIFQYCYCSVWNMIDVLILTIYSLSTQYILTVFNIAKLPRTGENNLLILLINTKLFTPPNTISSRVWDVFEFREELKEKCRCIQQNEFAASCVAPPLIQLRREFREWRFEKPNATFVPDGRQSVTS